jgi:hypothetical protein
MSIIAILCSKLPLGVSKEEKKKRRKEVKKEKNHHLRCKGVNVDNSYSLLQVTTGSFKFVDSVICSILK